MKPISGAIDSLTSKYGAEAATTAVKQALTSKAVQSALNVSAASGTELSEEVVTELLQSAIEASPEIMKRESGKSIAEAITDVGAVSLLAGGGPQVLREGYTAIRGTPQEKAKAEQAEDAAAQPAPQPTPDTTAQAAPAQEVTPTESVVATPDQKPSEKIRDILAKMSREEARQKKTEIAANEGIVITEDLDIDESDEAVLQTYIDQYEADNQVDLDAELALLAEQETQSEESDIETESLATTITDIQEAPEDTENIDTEEVETDPEPEIPIEKDVEEISQSILDSVSQEDLGEDYAIVSDAVANVVNAANISTDALDQELDNVEAIAREYIDVAQNPESTPEASAKAAIAAEALLNIASVREAMPIVREAVPSAQDTLATGTKTSEQITQTSEVAPQKDAVQSGLWRIKRGATESNRPIDFYLEVQTADETFEKMNLEMTPNEYDSLIASGGQLRSYSLFDTSTIAKMLADLDRKYLKEIGLPADLTNEPLTELEVISLFFQKYLDQYNNNLAYVVNKTKMPYAGTPIILKSLGERIADVYSRMNDEQKRTVDEGLYTELQYIEDFMPTLKAAYEQMMALSYDDSFFSDKTDTEVADIANSSGDAPLVFRAEIELNKRANAPKYNYPTTRAMGLEPKSVFIENDSQYIDVASLSFRGIKFFSQIGIISDRKKKPKFKGQSGVNDGFVVFDGVTSKTKANKMAREILMESTYVPEFSAFYHEMPVSEFLRMNQNDPEISSQDIEMLESSKDGVVRVLLQREGSKKTAPSFILKTDEFSGVTSTGKKTVFARFAASNNVEPAKETSAYKIREKEDPKQTKKAYKAFRAKDGQVYPLYVGADSPLPIGKWLDAKEGGLRFFTEKNGVKRWYVTGATGTPMKVSELPQESQKIIRDSGYTSSYITALAYRPGWHTGSLPFNPQGAGAKDQNYTRGGTNKEAPYPHILYPDIVFAEVELSADVDYGTEFEQTAARSKDGKIITSLSGLSKLPSDGFYEYTTNSSNREMPGDWFIGGSLKINKILTQDEINSIMDSAGVARQKRLSGDLDLKSLGFIENKDYEGGNTYARLSFSTKNPSTVPMQTVQEQVMQLQQNAEVGGVIKVVQNISDLPKSVLSSLPQIPPGKTLKGVTDDNGDIYIIAQSMTSVKDAYRTIVHELSHKGIINMINKVGRGTAAYDALMANIMQMMTPYEADLDLIASDYGYDLNDKEQRLNAIFEWLSYRSERVAPSRYRRFKAALNRFIRAIFGRTLFDGNDIDMLIDRIRDQVKVGNKFYSIAISTPDAPVKMPEAAEAVYQKSQKAPQDYMTAVEKAIDGTFKWLGKIVDPGSWLSQFGIDTRKKDAFGNEYGIADDLLRRMTESNRVGQTYAKYVMKQILEPLGSDKSRYDLFSRYIYARDLQKDIELGLVSEFGEDTRHGFKSEQEFSEYFDLLDAEVKNSMDILAAVSRRDDEILNIFDELKSLKLIPAETLRDPRYFHHAVLKYMDAKTGGVFGRAAKRVKGGEAKGRTGTESSADIYFTSYIEAEGEYIADAISRIHFNIDLNRIGSVYNVKKKLTDMANAKNIKDVSKIEADLIRKADPDISEEDFVEKLNQMPLAQFRKSILILSNKMVESSSIDLAFALYSMDKSTRSSISFEDFYKIVDDIVYRINSALPAVGAYAEENNIKINSKADAIKVVADLMAEEQTFQNDLVMRFFTGEINLVQMASYVVRNPESIHHKQILKTSLGLLGSISKRKKYIKDTLGDRFRTYRTILSNAKNNVIIKGDKADPFDIAMAEYTEYNPSQSLNMYYTNTADEFNLNMLALEGKTSIDVDKLKKALAISAPNNWVIPQDLSDAMTNFKPYDRAGIPDAGAGRVLYQVNALSRYLILFSPEKFINYFTNNALSDFGKAAIFFPKAVADRARNMRCLKTSINMADGQYNELAKLATFLRVVDTGVYMRDIDSIRKAFNNDEYLFHFLNKTEPKENADKYISKVNEVVGGLFSKYTNAVTTINQVRENFQRLVVFDYVLSEAEKGNYVEGVTPDYMRGAVKKLGDAPYAARIARDAIGDYGNLSLNGLAMRNTLIFFYGFMETNFTAYYNYFRNAAIRSLPEGFNGNFASRKDQMEWLVKASAVITAQGALAALPATMLIAAAFAMFPEETEEIMQTAEEDKGPIRIPIGKKDPKTGYIPTVGYSDTFFDFLSWIGIETPYKVGAVISGKKSATDVAIEAPINGIKKAIGSFTGPLNLAGVVAGQSYFPDIFNPRPIERDVAVANMLGLGGSYKWLAGHPKTGTGEYLSMLPTVRYVSPGEANYRYTQGLVDKIRQKKGLSTSRMDIERSPKDYAKYMYRKSVQYGDAKSAQHWLEEFQELGGNRSSLRYDLQATDPLNGLNGTGVSKSRFMSELTPAQRKSVVDGISWWKNFYGKLR
jgi:hypothetical protein